jgi:predicted N-acyltransferase
MFLHAVLCPDYKWARGFDPALIHSVHYLCNPGLRRAVYHFLASETDYNIALTEHLTQKSAVAREGIS